MKRKILVFAPILAMAIAGCFPRIPLDPSGTTSGSKTTTQSTSGSKPSSGTGSSGTTTGTSGTSSTTPTPAETYGTLDNPIDVARALEIAAAIPGAASDNTVFETKDAYIKGIVLNAPEESSRTAGTYRFNIGGAYGASQSVQFYWGKIDAGINIPVQGDEVVLFGRLANYHNGQTYELAGNNAKAIPDPVVKKSSHVTCTITAEESEHGTVTGFPATAKTGDVITLTVTPEAEYSVEWVKVNGNEIMPSEDVYKFTVVTNSVITASFVQGPVQHTAMELAYKAAQSGSTDEFTFSGVVIGTSGKDYYIQDGSYGMYVYNSTAPEGLAVGKVVEVTATVKTYNNIVETNVVKSAEIKGDGDLPNAVSIASLEGLSALNQNILMDFAGKVTFVSRKTSQGADVEWSSSADAFVTFTVGQDDIKVKFAKTAYDADKAALVNAAVAGDQFELANMITAVFKTDFQPTFTAQSTISKEAVIPTKVIINVASDEVVEGGELALDATIEPAGATDELVWSLAEGDEAYAKIENGVLKALKPGKVTLGVALANYPDVHDSKIITINEKQKVYVESITPDPESLALEVGETKSIQITVLPATGVEEDISWSVIEGEDVVEIDANHGIKGLKAGEAKVRIEGAESHVGCTVPVSVDYALSSLQEVNEAAVAGSQDTFKFKGTVTSTSGKDYYIQDGAWGMYIYNTTAPEGLAVGKEVQVTATVKTYNNIIETNSVKSAVVIGDGTMPTAVDVASASELAALNQSVLMNLATGVFVSRTKSDGKTAVDWASNADAFVTLTVGSDNIKVKFSKNSYDADKAAILNAAVAGDKLDLGNMVSAVFKTENQPTFTSQSTISKVVVAPEKVTINLASLTVVEGGELDLAATIEPEGATDELVWSLGQGDETYAKIENGKLVALKAGSVNLTVTLKNYPDITDVVTVVIEAPQKKLVESIVADPASLELDIDESKTVALTINPSDYEEEISWSIKEGGEEIISLDSEHNIKGLKAGTATVRIEGAESHVGCDLAVTVKAPVYTVSQAYALAEEAGKTGTAEAISFKGVVHATLGNFYFVSDGTSGMYCRPSDAVEGVAVGKEVTTVAKVGTYSNLVETTSFSSAVVGDTGAVTPAVDVASLEALTEIKHNMPVNVEVTLASKPASAWSKTNYVRPTVKIGSDETAITITLEKNPYNDTFGELYNNAQVGDKFILRNVLRAQFNNNVQLDFIDQSSIEAKVVTPESVTVTPSANEVAVGAKVTLSSVINPVGAKGTVVYELAEGDEAYASLSENELTGLVAGHTVTVNAHVDGYPDANGSCEVTVVDPAITALAFKESSYEIAKGNEKEMAAELVITPNGGVGELEWAIDLEGVTVSELGVVTVSDSAVAESKANLTVTVKGTEISATTEIKVAAEQSKVYSKVTSIAVNDEIALVVEAKGKYLTGISTTSTKYGLGSNIPEPFSASAFELTVVAGASEGTFAFKTSDDKYLCWTSGNSLNVTDKLDASSSWTVSFNANNNAVICNSGDSARQIWWNNGSPRFACYTGKTEADSGYSPLQLYKLA